MKKMILNQDWLETRKRRKWRRKKSSGSCSTPLIMTSRKTRQGDKLLLAFFLSKWNAFQYLCKHHILQFPLCDSSFGLFFTWLIIKKKKEKQDQGQQRISGCALEKCSLTVNHMLPHSYLPSWLWESCKQPISSPWTAVAPLTPTWKSLSSLTRRRSLTQRFTRKRSTLSSMRPLLSRWAETPRGHPLLITYLNYMYVQLFNLRWNAPLVFLYFHERLAVLAAA